MKTLRNRHSRNRTYRRVQRGGYSIPVMNENIDIIKSSTVENFGGENGGRVNVRTLQDSVNSSEFRAALDLVQLEGKQEYIDKFNEQVTEIMKTTDRKKGPGQKLIDNKTLLPKLKEALAGLRLVLNSMSNKVAALPQRVLPPRLQAALPQRVLPPLPQSPPQTPSPSTLEPPPLALSEQRPEQQAAPVEAPASQLEAPVDTAAQPAGQQQPEQQAEPVEAPPTGLSPMAAWEAEMQRSRESLARIKENARRPFQPSLVSPQPLPIVSPQPQQSALPNYVAPELATNQQPLSNAAPEPSLESLFRALPPRKGLTKPPPQTALPTLEVGQSAKPPIPLSEVNPLRRGTPLQPQATPQNISLRQPDINPQTICERDFPEVYRVLKLGKPYLSLLFSNTGIEDPRVQQLLKLIQYEKRPDGVYLMGTSINKVLAACHPDRGLVKDPEMTEIFQMLDAIKNYTGVKAPVLDLPSILRIASSAAPAIGAVQQPGRPDRKPSAPEPPVDFSRMFKKGDRLRPIEILTDPSTGQSPILTVVGDYNADTQSIEVSYGGETMSVPVRGLHYRFKVIQRANKPEKKLFKKDERVLMKLPGNLARLPQALRTEIEKGSCAAPFYATVQADQDARSERVIIKCDKGPEKPFSVLDSQLSYGVKALEVPPQPNPVAPLAVDGSAPLRRGLAEVKTSNPAKTPGTMTDCDRQLFTMTERAKTCETKLATLQQELAEMTAANKAETERLQADIAAEKARLAQLQASKTEVEQNLKTATQTEQTLREHIGTYGKQLGEFRTKTDALEGQNRSIKDEIAATTARLQQTEQEIARLNQQSAEDSARFEQLNKVLRKANDERNDLIGRLAQSTSELTKATQEQENLQAAYTKKLVELEVAKDSLADLNTRFATTDALITAADQRITHQLAAISGTLNEEIDNIAEGIKYAIGLTEETRGDIAASRAEFTRRFGSLQQDLAVSNLETRTSIIAEMRDLRASNEQNMAALQANLAATTAEKNQLQHQIAEEQAAKARVEGELEAKKQEIARKEQEYAQALDAARQTASNTAQQLQDAYTTASQAEVIRLQDVHGANIARLTSQLSAAIARAAAAETNTEDRNRLTAGLTEELVRLRAQIAAIPPPAPVVVPPPAVAPRIISRSPEGDVQVGRFITITWNSNRTPGPWILRVDYNGTNPDFQEVTLDQDISYQIKRPGALSGRIYSVTQV